MSATNIVAEGVETYGVRTFSAKEMSFNILGLCSRQSPLERIWKGKR